MNNCLSCGAKLYENITIRNLFKKPDRLCDRCKEDRDDTKPDTKARRCLRCLKYLNQDEAYCLDCKFLSAHLNLMEQLYYQFQYDGLMKEVIHQHRSLKDYYLRESLAHLTEVPQTSYDCTVPVPPLLAYNLSRVFSPVEAVLKAKRIRFDKILKMSNRSKQSHLIEKERLADKNPFITDAELDLNGKEILLVNDIYTTGLTIHRAGYKSCAKNIRKFKVFTLAR